MQAKWTEPEIGILRENYGKINPKQIPLNRSLEAIRLKARYLKIKPQKNLYLKPLKQKLNLTIGERAYIAGFIDGEGSVSINLCTSTKGRFLTPKIQVTNTNKEIIAFLKERIGGNVRESDDGNIKHKKYYNLVIAQNLQITEILKLLIPHLRIKKKNARLLLKFCKSRTNHYRYSNREFGIYNELKKLNQRGGDI